MAPPGPQEERQPLLAAGSTAAEAGTLTGAPRRTASSSSASSSAGGGGGGAGGPVQVAQLLASAAAPRYGPCRICLEDEEDPSKLERPCSCSGTMQWAHHACIQRWVDEKHDKRCELCGCEYRCRQALRDPPPRPRPHPLVAQLHIDNNDNRIVLLADPETGAIVARVVMPPGEDAADAQHLAAGLERWRRSAAAAAAAGAGTVDAEGEDGEERRCDPTLPLVSLALLMFFVVAILGWLGAAADEGGEAAANAGAWVVRIVLLSAWLGLRAFRPVPRIHRAERARRQVPFIDLEAGQPPAHRRAGGSA